MKAFGIVLYAAYVLLMFSCQTQTMKAESPFISVENRVILRHDEYIEAQYEIWVPSEEQTVKTLKVIYTFLLDADSNNDFDDYFKSEIKKIIKNRDEFRVQFVGIIEDNNKYIHCNFIPKSVGSSEWKKRLITVEDGGFWFWQIFYDVELKKIKKIYINGYA